jgi:hypothetical protein
MTMQKNRPLIAVPNVLRDQTLPNQLGGMRQATAAPVRTARRRLPIRAIAVVAAAALAVLWILIGRGA